MSAPADDDVVVHGDAERGGDVDDRFRHLDVRTRRRGIAARMVVQNNASSPICLFSLYFSTSPPKKGTCSGDGTG
jgi:hypothetical protein